MRRIGNLASLAIAWTVWGTVSVLGRILEPRLPELPDDDYDYAPFTELDEPDWVEDETGERA